LRAAALGRTGDYPEAIAVYDDLLAEYPTQPKIWMSQGHALKTVGRQAEAVAAYRRAIEQLPSLGEAYWSLANLKTFRFEAAEIAAMRDQLARDDLTDEDRFHLDFALGKALEDAGDFAASFAHYQAGNALRRRDLDYDPDEASEHVRRCKALFTNAFFAERAGQGSPAPDPVFVVGLPRSGSTLIEQILSSHSQIEGTMELPDLGVMARRLGSRRRMAGSDYPENLAALSPAELAALGE
jgi:tetratricopeptide (TPR) repeat protein